MIDNNSFLKRAAGTIGMYMAFLLIFIVVYAPVVQTGFFYLDDYAYFTTDGPSLESFMGEALIEGRILEGPILYAISTLIKSSESTRQVRLIGIVGVALFASVLFAVFKRSRFRADHAFLMSISICTLPFIQLFAAWMIVIPSIYSAFLSSLSALMLFSVMHKDHANKIWGWLAAIILSVAALSINQPPAMMYWAVGCLFFLSDENSDFSRRKSRQNIISFFSVGLISMAIYYAVVVKLIPHLLSIATHRGTLLPFRSIPGQLIWFLKGPVIRTMNMWNADPTYIFAAFTGIIILTGIIMQLIHEIKTKKNISIIHYIARYSIISIMVIMCYLPKLIVTEPTIVRTYWNRTLVSLAPAVTMLFYFALANIIEYSKLFFTLSDKAKKSALTIVLALLAIFTSYTAHSNVQYFSTLYAEELRHIKKSVEDYGVEKLLNASKIYIRRPTVRAYPIDDRFNEFKGTLTTAPEGGFILNVVKRALHDIGIWGDMKIHSGNIRGNIEITHGAVDDTVPAGEDVLIIDMTSLEKLDKYMKEKQ